jgi:pimeloyl-ACP methyl ester carboxylesterase
MTSFLLGDAAVRVVSLPGQGIELAYREAGHGDPLLLIMGLGADSAAWDQHVRAWASTFRCVAVDNRGAGSSSAPPGPYSTAMLADDCAELIGELGLGPVPVAGISMGGAIAQELALRHPGLVSKLVLVSTWARLDRYAAEIFQNLAAMRAQADRAAFTQLLQLWIWNPGWFEQSAAGLVAERAAAGPAMAQHAFAAQAMACAGHDTASRLGQISVPTLITAGSRDVFTPLRFARQLAAAIPGARLEIFDEAAHAHHWERLEDFNALVKEWLQ